MDNFKKQILQVVVGLSIDLNHVKKAIGVDSGVFSSYVSKLEMLLDKYWSGWWLPFLFAAHTSTKLFVQVSIWCERGEEGEKR